MTKTKEKKIKSYVDNDSDDEFDNNDDDDDDDDNDEDDNDALVNLPCMTNAAWTGYMNARTGVLREKKRRRGR